MAERPQSLPLAAELADTVAKLAAHRVSVLTAPPGAGKSTLVAPALPTKEGERVWLVQPRRMAAKALAGYLAAQRNEAPGQSVGYHIRHERVTGAQTCLEIMTTGIFLRRLQANPELTGVAWVVLDEFHERSWQLDLALTFSLEALQALNENCRLLLMSATLDARPLASWLGKTLASDAACIELAARNFPVKIQYCPPPRNDRWLESMPAVIEQAAATIADGEAVLVFLPGLREIRWLQQRLSASLGRSFAVHILHSQASPREQQAALHSDAGVCRIILATNIAETSLTIPAVTAVVDSGRVRKPVFDATTEITRLATTRITAASATQRCGRAGRVKAGRCYRLWSAEENTRMQPFPEPDIRHCDLRPLLLEVVGWAGGDAGLPWLEPPPKQRKDQAWQWLQAHNLITTDATLTDQGKAVLTLGTEPALARLCLLARDAGFAAWGALVATLIARPLAEAGPWLEDQAERALALWGNHSPAAREWRQLCRSLGCRAELKVPEREQQFALLAPVFFGRLAERAPTGKDWRLPWGGSAQLDLSAVASHYLLALSVQPGAPQRSAIRLAWPLSEAQCQRLTRDYARSQAHYWFDDKSGKVRCERRHCLGQRVLEREPIGEPDPQKISDCLLAAILARPLKDSLAMTSADAAWLARAQWAREHGGWSVPELSEAGLKGKAEEWLAPFLAGCQSLAEVQKLSIRMMLRSWLGEARYQELDKLAPPAIVTPVGETVALDYDSEIPVLRAPVQWFYGRCEPFVCGRQRVPVILEMLSPARRPLQRTAEPGRFWRNGWAAVAAEMRGRYPKHYWPGDPATARPVKGTKKQNSL